MTLHVSLEFPECLSDEEGPGDVEVDPRRLRGGETCEEPGVQGDAAAGDSDVLLAPPQKRR